MTVHLSALVDNVYYPECPDVFQFPGGEFHLRNVPDYPGGETTLIADVRGADANDLVKAALWETGKIVDDRFALLLPYLPAARADRGFPYGARSYAHFINALDADYVIGIDPHSVVSPGEINNFVECDFVPLLERAVATYPKYDAVIAPDKGAISRAQRAADALELPVVRFDKKRDFETGKILGIHNIDDIDPHARYLVVDDICDGGGTFVALAEAGGFDPLSLGLWVTHGIFSGKADQLRKHYENIYTTDSHPGHNRVGVATTVIPTKYAMLDTLKEALCKKK